VGLKIGDGCDAETIRVENNIGFDWKLYRVIKN